MSKSDVVATIINEKISRIPKDNIQDFVSDLLDLIDSYIED